MQKICTENPGSRRGAKAFPSEDCGGFPSDAHGSKLISFGFGQVDLSIGGLPTWSFCKATCHRGFYCSPAACSDSQCPRFHECRNKKKAASQKTRRRFCEAANLPILRTHNAATRDLLFGVRKTIKVRPVIRCELSCCFSRDMLIRFSLEH